MWKCTLLISTKKTAFPKLKCLLHKPDHVQLWMQTSVLRFICPPFTLTISMQLAGNTKMKHFPHIKTKTKHCLYNIIYTCNFEEIISVSTLKIQDESGSTNSLFLQQLNPSLCYITVHVLFSPFENNDPKMNNPATSQHRQGSQQKNPQHIHKSVHSSHSHTIIHCHSLSLWLVQRDCQPFLSQHRLH